MAKFEGRGKCDRDCCGAPVDVYSDKNGLAYYNCGPCGFRGIHRTKRSSAAFLAEIDRHAEPEDGPPAAPPPAPAGRPAPPKPAPTPAPAPVRENPEKSKKSPGGFLSNLSLI